MNRYLLAPFVCVRIIGLIFCCATGSVDTIGQDVLSKRVYLDCDPCTAGQALVQLSEKTGVSISFSEDFFATCAPVNLRLKNETTRQALDQLIQCNWMLAYKVVDNTVIIYANTGKKSVYGYVKDVDTGESLTGALVQIGGQTASTNAFGYYHLVLPVGQYDAKAIMFGYERSVLREIQLKSNRQINFQLKSRTQLPEIIVLDTVPFTLGRNAKSSNNAIALSTENLVRMAAPGGQPDLIRYLAGQTGVQTGVDGLGGLNVRGGNADANLILMDDAPVYNPGHFLGLFSIFNAHTIQQSTFWKGDFPARYGGRTASVLDVRLRDGNQQNHQAQIGTGLFATEGLIEGPIVKNQGSYLLAGRFTYFRPWINILRQRPNLVIINDNSPDYRYGDMNIKLNYRLGPNDRIFLSGYYGGDFFFNPYSLSRVIQTGTFRDQYLLKSEWGNQIGTIRWNHVYKKGVFSNTTLRYSTFQYQSDLGFKSDYTANDGRESTVADYIQLYQTIIRDLSIKTDFEWRRSQQVTWRWGGAWTRHDFKPGALSVNFKLPGQSQITADSLASALFNSDKRRCYEGELYGEFTWQFHPRWRLEGGLNSSVFLFNHNDPTPHLDGYGQVLPRLNLSHEGRGGWRQWLFYGHSGQYLHQIGSFNLNLPFELWVPSTVKVKPEHGWQTNSGISWTNERFGAQAEIYYKELTNLIVLRSSNEALIAGGAEDASGWEDRLSTGNGISKGLEFATWANTKHWDGRVTYTLSRTTRQFDDINEGRPFLFRFDRTHNLQVQTQIKLGKRVDLDMAWAYATGNPITLSGVKYEHQSPDLELGGREVVYYSGVNEWRLPDYHRLDITFGANIGATKHLQHKIQLGAYNIYNRANPFFILLQSGSEEPGKAIQYSLLPILPIIRYEIKLF
jgi:hypothetical protein